MLELKQIFVKNFQKEVTVAWTAKEFPNCTLFEVEDKYTLIDNHFLNIEETFFSAVIRIVDVDSIVTIDGEPLIDVIDLDSDVIDFDLTNLEVQLDY